jgi:hypothetical protein
MDQISRHTYQHGFIALMSAIVISALLLAVTFSVGFIGFFARFNLIDSESKEKSFILAESCLEVAIANIVQDPAFNPINQKVTVGSESCTIVSVSNAGVLRTVKTFAVINKAHTNLKAVFDTVSFRLISEIECENFSSC